MMLLGGSLTSVIVIVKVLEKTVPAESWACTVTSMVGVDSWFGTAETIRRFPPDTDTPPELPRTPKKCTSPASWSTAERKPIVLPMAEFSAMIVLVRRMSLGGSFTSLTVTLND